MYRFNGSIVGYNALIGGDHARYGRRHRRREGTCPLLENQKDKNEKERIKHAVCLFVEKSILNKLIIYIKIVSN